LPRLWARVAIDHDFHFFTSTKAPCTMATKSTKRSAKKSVRKSSTTAAKGAKKKSKKKSGARRAGAGGARAHAMTYFFGRSRSDGDGSMKALLGGKGANLAEMSRIGLPVPPGFTITTEVCARYYEEGRKLPAGL